MYASMKEQFKALMRDWCPPIVRYQIDYLKSDIDNRSAFRQAGVESDAKSFASIHSGEDCFILGAGPSVLEYDLSKLSGKHVITVANTYVHPCLSDMNPRYHVLPNVFRAHAGYHCKESYVNWLRDMDSRLPEDTAMVMDIHDQGEVESNELFMERDILWFASVPWQKQELNSINIKALPRINSVSEAAIMAAIFMGYENIYLLGFDHDYNGKRKYFYDCTDHKVGLTDENVADMMRDTASEAMGTALIMQRYKMLSELHPTILNCNTDSYIQIFPKIPFEEALNQCSCP